MSTVGAARQAGHVARRMVAEPWVTLLARCGYIAKGVVYIIIGSLAFRAALGAGGAITDPKGAILTIYQQPYGSVLLGVATVGLFGFAVWSFIQAWMDTEGKGSDAGGIAARLGYVTVGVSYLILAYTSLQLVLGAGNTGKSSDATTRDWTARLLALPFGPALVVVVGLIITCTALYLFYKAYSVRFRRRLNLAGLSAGAQEAVVILGRCGYAAQGVVFTVIGIFLIIAALRHNAHEAKGLGGALRELAQQPYGPVLLGISAAGLFIYGIYSLAEARYRMVGVA
jgi:hypothetical protein